MHYLAYQAHADFLQPFRLAADLTAILLGGREGPAKAHPETPRPIRAAAAALRLFADTTLTHSRPAFGIDRVSVRGSEQRVTEEVALHAPFANLINFRKDMPGDQPRVLVVAPLSGHFSTLLVDTVRTLLPDHDVFITDWLNGREVPLSAGPFAFDDYVDHIIRFLEFMGPGAHLVAVCQPCVQALVAAAVMAEDDHSAQPASMTLMAGPIDTRISPTKVNELASSKPISWFENTLIATVPPGFAGSGRRVYPGFVQLTAFVSMNMERHMKAHKDLYDAMVAGEVEKVESARTFYDEYFAVLDLPAEFYLETVQWVFQEHRLPLGTLQYRGRTVDPRAIRRTALLTVEGERDDICAVGQTLAAHDLCSSLRPYRKRHHLQAGVGHYGVFSGRRWANQIYPLVRNMILANS